MTSESSSSDSSTTRRFVVLRHDVGPQFDRSVCKAGSVAHFDWMFESGGKLRTWSTDLCAPIVDGFGTVSDVCFDSIELPCEALQDHRIAYLTHEGDIGGGRGRVGRVLEGTYTELFDHEDRFEVELQWQHEQERRCARLCIYRNRLLEEGPRRDESRPLWLLSLSTGW